MLPISSYGCVTVLQKQWEWGINEVWTNNCMPKSYMTRVHILVGNACLWNCIRWSKCIFTHNELKLLKEPNMHQKTWCKEKCIYFLPTEFSDIESVLLREDHGHHEHEAYYGDRDTDSLVAVRT